MRVTLRSSCGAFQVAFFPLTLLAGLFAGPALASVLRVPRDFGTIQEAINAAAQGDVVRVSPGTYAEILDFRGKRIRLESTDGPEATIVDAQGVDSVVVFRRGEGRDTILEGFTLRNGIGGIHGPGFRFGGGIFCEGSSPTIRGNIIRDNQADLGGGIDCWLYSAPLIEQNLILDNEAILANNGQGGGILCEETCDASIRDNTIIGNSATFRGGGIACNFDASPVIEGNTISENTAPMGGGISCSNGASPTLLRNLISSNSAATGGGIGSQRAALAILSNQILFNDATVGGAGIWCGRADLPGIRIQGNVIRGNEAAFQGGGIGLDNSGGVPYMESKKPLILIANNLIIENSASMGYMFQGGGGIHAIDYPHLRIINNTIVRNRAPYASAIHLLGYFHPRSLAPSNPWIANTIMWGNRDWPQIVIEVGRWPFRPGPATMFNNYIEPWVVSSALGWSGNPPVADSDRLFVDALHGDYHLRIGSPCVDAGDNGITTGSSDFEGDDRILNGNADPEAIVDIGADELLPEAAARFGTVNAAGASLANVLLVNGSVGDPRGREVTVPPGASLHVEMVLPPAGPDPAHFVLYAWDGKPDSTTITPQPFHLGVMGHATPLRGDPADQPIVIWNNLGHESRLGVPDHPSHPAPSVIVDAPGGVAYQTIATLQGFIEDAGSAAGGPVSITNAVVVNVIQ